MTLVEQTTILYFLEYEIRPKVNVSFCYALHNACGNRKENNIRIKCLTKVIKTNEESLAS